MIKARCFWKSIAVTWGTPAASPLASWNPWKLSFPPGAAAWPTFTGIGDNVLAEILGGIFVNEVIALGWGTDHFLPEARSHH